MDISNLAVLWDMDGTILDTLELHYLTWKEALNGRTTLFSYELFRQNFGSNNRLSLPIYLGYEPDEAYYQQLVTAKEERFRELLPTQSNLFPGVRAWFEYFYSHGARQAIASSASRENIQTVLDSFEISDYFATLVSGDDLPSKPAPDIFLRAAQRLTVDPRLCVVFEDSIHGLRAARAAGMVSIAVAGTTDFKQDDADILLPDYQRDPEPYLVEILRLMKE
ncbi:MAG: HAD family phosphatase [Anaerolineaceae bacterium]